MEITSSRHKRLNQQVKTVLLLPEDYTPLAEEVQDTLNELNLNASTYVFKPYTAYEQIAPFIAKKNTNLASKVDQYIDGISQLVNAKSDKYFTGNGLRKELGLPKLENRLMRFNVVFDESFDKNIAENRRNFQQARNNYFYKEEGKFFPVHGTTFDSLLRPVSFVSAWDAKGPYNFKVKTVVERSDMATQARDVFNRTARDIAEIAFYNSRVFEKQHDMYVAEEREL